MEWKEWSSVPLDQKNWLPLTSGIYVIADSSDFVWYVGKAKNLRRRWLGRSHHRYAQLIRSHKRLVHRIYWKSCPLEGLDENERLYIFLFKPELNDEKVKRYIPSKPANLRELQRILRVINKPSFFYPEVRSLVVGSYFTEQEVQRVIIALSDQEYGILYNSMNKKRAPSIRKAWSVIRPDCGKPEDLYEFPYVYVYSVDRLVIEFVLGNSFMDDFRKNVEHYKQDLERFRFLDVDCQGLKRLDLVREISVPEEESYVSYNNKTWIKSFAYLKYRLNVLVPLVNADRISNNL